MGTVSPMQIDFARVRKLVERPDISSDLAVIKIHSVYDLLDCFVVGEDGLRRMASSVPLNTDDKPLLEFGAAIKRDIEGCWMAVLGLLIEEHCPVSHHITNTGETEEESRQVQATLEQYFKGTGHALRGLLGILQGDPAIMEREFEKARNANPEDRDVDSCLDELDSEIKALVRTVGRTPRNAPLRARLAKRYLLLRDYARAAEQYVSFLNLEAGDAAVWNNLGICYNKLEQFAKAVGAFERATKCDASLVSAYFNLGDVYGQLGNFAASSRNYEKALSLSPHSRTAYVYDKLARAYFMQKEYSLALGALEKALELASNDPALQRHLQSLREAVMRAAEGMEP